MVTATLTAEHESTKMGQYLKKMNRRLVKSRLNSIAFDERITLTNTGWFFDRQPVITHNDKTGAAQSSAAMPEFMTYAVNEYGGIDNLLRFMDIKVEFVLSLS